MSLCKRKNEEEVVVVDDVVCLISKVLEGILLDIL